MRRPDRRSLWESTAAGSLSPRRFVADSTGRFVLADFAQTYTLAAPPEAFRGRTVLISCHRQLPTIQVLLQLDGIARRILLCPPDLAGVHIPAVIAEAEVDVILSDGTGPAAQFDGSTPVIAIGADPIKAVHDLDRTEVTEWLLFTSGTTGRPKIVVHTLASLAGPLDDDLAVASDAVWSTFYDIRRYGGLQILLRALLGGGSIVLSQAHEAVDRPPLGGPG
jgi:hypothetical protein